MRCAIIEAETREDVMKEMEERMREIEKTYSQRLMREVESIETLRIKHQLTMLARLSGMIAKWMQRSTCYIMLDYLVLLKSVETS